jgi:hypothetical protein
MDRSKLIASLVESHGVKLDQDDPAFVLVELNAMVFDELTQPILDRLESTLDQLSEISDNLDEKTAIFTKQVANLNAGLDEKTAIFIKQVDNMKASKELLIAEIALRSKKQMDVDLKNIEDKYQRYFKKFILWQFVILLPVLVAMQIIFKFLKW